MRRWVARVAACALVISGVTVANSLNSTSARADTLTTGQQVGHAVLLGSVACTDVIDCLAVGFFDYGSPPSVGVYSSVIGSGSTLLAATAKEIAGTSTLSAVACEPGTVYCFAVGTSSSSGGVIVPFSNGVPGTLIPVSGVSNFGGVSCESSTSCVAVGAGTTHGLTVTITNGVVGSPVTDTHMDGFASVACMSSTACEAIGVANVRDYAVTLVNGVPTTERSMSSSTDQFVSIACEPGISTCFAVGYDYASGASTEVEIDNGVVGTLAHTQIGPDMDSQFSGISCPSIGKCIAVGYLHDANRDQTNGTVYGGAANVSSLSTATPAFPVTAVQSAFDGIGCSDATDCVIAGLDADDGDGLVVADTLTPTAPTLNVRIDAAQVYGYGAATYSISPDAPQGDSWDMSSVYCDKVDNPPVDLEGPVNAGTHTTDGNTCHARLTGPTANTYQINFVDGTFTQARADLSITAPSAGTNYGAAIPALHPQFGRLWYSDTVQSVGLGGVTCSAPGVSQSSSAGTYLTICAGPAGPLTNYVLHYVTGVLVINRGHATVTAPSPTITYGTNVPNPLTPQVGGLVNGDTATSAGLGSVTCSTTASATNPGVGAYPVTCSGPASTTNYTVSYNGGTLTVLQSPTSISLSAAPTAPSLNQAVTLTAAVSHTGGGVAPTGTVSFYDGSTLLGTSPVTSGGGATLVAAFGGGSHALSASYSGDTDYLASSTTSSVAVITTCTRTTSGSSSSIGVSSGTTCLTPGTRVSGGVVVSTNGELDLEGVTVTGSLSVSGATTIRICGSTIGSLSVSHVTGFVLVGDPRHNCAPNRINGSIVIVNNHGGVVVGGNTYAGGLMVSGNTGSGPLPGENGQIVYSNKQI